MRDMAHNRHMPHFTRKREQSTANRNLTPQNRNVAGVFERTKQIGARAEAPAPNSANPYAIVNVSIHAQPRWKGEYGLAAFLPLGLFFRHAPDYRLNGPDLSPDRRGEINTHGVRQQCQRVVVVSNHATHAAYTHLRAASHEQFKGFIVSRQQFGAAAFAFFAVWHVPGLLLGASARFAVVRAVTRQPLPDCR